MSRVTTLTLQYDIVYEGKSFVTGVTVCGRDNNSSRYAAVTGFDSVNDFLTTRETDAHYA